LKASGVVVTQADSDIARVRKGEIGLASSLVRLYVGPEGKDYGHDGFHVSGTLDKRPGWLLDHG
jgi:hypothetical protein